MFSEMNRLDAKIMNVKSKAFTPSYKKPSSYNGGSQIEEAANSIAISELDIIGQSNITIDPINRPKSPLRHQSSSTVDLHKTENLIDQEK